MRATQIVIEDSECIELLSEGTASHGAAASPEEATASAVDSKPRRGSAEANVSFCLFKSISNYRIH